MKFTCTAVVRDAQEERTITATYDRSRADLPFGMEVVVEDAGARGAVTVRRFDVTDDGQFIRVYYMLGADFVVPCQALLIPVDGQSAVIIGGWQTGLEASGVKLQGFTVRARMKEVDRLGLEGIRATLPDSYAESPEQLIDPREIELVSLEFRPLD